MLSTSVVKKNKQYKTESVLQALFICADTSDQMMQILNSYISGTFITNSSESGRCRVCCPATSPFMNATFLVVT